MERLQKIIANSGYCSRRKAEELIKTGHVMVNAQMITEMGYKAKSSDDITIDGNSINHNIKKEYYILNKPRGIISSASDEVGRTTVVDLINSKERIYPIGRLDYDTSGLILLTNDGEFANLLMHPRNEIMKTYLAKIDGIMDKEAIDKLKHGVIVDDREVKIIDFNVKKRNYTKNTSLVQITICEGRNHIIKNLFKVLGYNVVKLSRISYGFLTLDGLNVGEYRALSIKEVKRFYGTSGSAQ